MTGKTSISGRVQGAFSPNTVAPGTSFSQKAKIKIKKIPVANSGVTENIIPPIERIRSSGLPSFSPAIIPRISASGITITKAVPAKTSELRRRINSRSATGRPVRNETPGSPRNKPLCNGMYSTGPPVKAFQPVSLDKYPDFLTAACFPAYGVILRIDSPKYTTNFR